MSKRSSNIYGSTFNSDPYNSAVHGTDDSPAVREIAGAALENRSIARTDDIGKTNIPGAGTAILSKESNTAVDRAKGSDGSITGGSDSVTNERASHESRPARTSASSSKSIHSDE